MSASIACFAAAFTVAGAGKFGKPCARLIPPCIALSRVISRMTDSVNPTVRAASRALATRISVLLREVHAIEQRLAGLVAAKVLSEERERPLLHSRRIASGVRRDDDVLERPERAVGRQRL